jgi:hypothetical protein
VAQLVERLGLDLADALAGDPKTLADLFERALVAVADAELGLIRFGGQVNYVVSSVLRSSF